MRQLHHLPLLSEPDLGFVRVGGPGLGNLLFPIGRALIGRERWGGTLVYPTMRQFKLGPILRREADKRIYGRVLRARRPAEWRDWFAVRHMTRVGEDAAPPDEPAVITYTGMRNHFHDLAGHRELIAGWLAANRYGGALPAGPGHDIAVHVRLGDFAAASTASSGDPSIRLPLDWYRHALTEARGLAATASPRVLLFTDGDAGAVAAGLGHSGIEVDRSGDALTAMQHIAQARVLVGSRSTFSMWGTYLGGTAAVWDRSFDLATYFPARPGLDIFV